MRRLLVAIVVLFLCGSAAAAEGGGAPLKEPLKTQERRFTVRVTPEMIRHSRIYDVLYFVGFFYSVGVLLLILNTRVSARLRDVARVRWRFVAAMLYFALLSIVTTAVEFPLTLYAGFIVPHQFALTHQSFASWLGDFAKAVAVDIAVGAFLAALTLLAIRIMRRWWIAVWLGTVPVIIIGIVLTPLIIDPLFNDFVPLRDPVLRRDLLSEAARAGIEGSRVYQVNKSKQTTEMNAYVTGIGPSKRIVLWDTLLAKLDHDEIIGVMGHEMGHYVMHHLWKGIAFAVAIALIVIFAGQRAYESGLARWGAKWAITDSADPAALPWLLVIVSTILFLLSPVTSAYSRHLEHQADKFGLELTHLNEATASSFVKFAEDSKVDPDPPRFIEWWRYSHPAPRKRIEFALEYREAGKRGSGEGGKAATPPRY